MSSSGGTSLRLGANTLTISGASILTGSVGFFNGMVEANGAIDLQGGLTLEGTQMMYGSMTLGNGAGNGGLALNNSAMATNSGTLTLLKDSQISASVTNPGTLVNEGTWLKSGGLGQAGVSAPVSLADGSPLNLQSGSMLFTNGVAIGDATIDTQLTSGQLSLVSGVAISGNLKAMSGTNSIQINGSSATAPVLDMTGGGMITSTGTSGFVIGGNVLGKGSQFSGSGTAPVILTGAASLGNESSATNTGRFIWDSGTIRDLTNTADGADLFTIEDGNQPGVRSLVVADGTLKNEGRIEHSAVNVQLGEDGILNNALGGVYDFETGGSVVLLSGSNGQFVNTGILTKSGTSLSVIEANLTSSNRIEASNGTLQLAGATSLTNVIRSDRGANANTTVRLGKSGTTNSYGSIDFELDNGGVVEFISGNHILGGSFTSSGNGEAHSTSTFAQFQVPMNSSASFGFIPGAPFIAGTNNADPLFDLAGSLTNTDTMHIAGMRLKGSGAFKNKGTCIVLANGLLEISEIGGAASGLLQNNGGFALMSANAGVRIQENGLFLNNEAGGPDADPIGGTLLFSDGGNFVTNDTSTATHLRNLALIQHASGNSSIAVNFDQPSLLAETRVEKGSLTLTKMANFNAGRLASHYLEFGTNPTPSRLNINGPSINGGLTLDLMNGGQVQYGGFNVDHQLSGTLFGQGNGECRLVGGLMRPMTGSTNGGFNFTQNTLFRMTGGLMGSLDGPLGNVGNFTMQGGTIQGSFNNGTLAEFTQTGGTVQGVYTNNGTYEWNSGTIGGMFSNGTAVTVDSGFVNLRTNTTKLLAAGATFDTWNEVNHFDSGALQMQTNSKLTVKDGVYKFHSTGTVSSNFTSGTKIRIDPTGEIRKTGTTVGGPNLTCDIFDSRGTITVDAGGLLISSDPININGGTARVDAGATLQLSREPQGTGFESIVANGLLRINSTGGGSRADYPQASGQTLTGTGTARLNLLQSGTVAPGASPGTLTVDGDLVQSATAITEIEIGGTAAGQFDVINVLDDATVAGMFMVTFTDGFAPQIGDQFAVVTSTSGVTLGSLAIQVTNAPFIGEAFTAAVVGNDLILTWTKTGQSFEDWKASKFNATQLADENISGPAADPDLDGIANLFEFIFGFEPLTSNSGHPIEFQLVNNGTPGQEVPRFEIAVATSISGFHLEVDLLDLTQNPRVVTPLSAEQDMSAPAGMIVLEGAAAVPIRQFYQIRANTRN